MSRIFIIYYMGIFVIIVGLEFFIICLSKVLFKKGIKKLVCRMVKVKFMNSKGIRM